jgi:hypothetical protein
MVRFAIEHERCAGEPEISTPTETDFVERDGVWTVRIALYCPGCGARRWEDVPFPAILAETRAQARRVGIDDAEFARLTATDEGWDELTRRIEHPDAVGTFMLAQIARLRGGGQN